MPIKSLRSRFSLFPSLVAAFALLAFSGCNSSNSAPAVTPTSVALSTTATSVNLGGTVTLTASLGSSSGATAPIGVVTFFDGTATLQATSITGGTTISTTQTLAAGVHTIPAAYAGDQNHAASTSSATTITVYVNSTTTLTASPALAASAAPVTLTATVAVAAGITPPTGSVIFYSGASALGTATISTVSGAQVATLVTTALTVNGASPVTYSITASYVASTYFLASTSSAVPVVIRPVPIVTSDTLTLSSPGTVASGTQETLSATVTAVSAGTSAPSGTITFYDTNTSVTPNTVFVLGTATVTNGTSTTSSASIMTKQFNAGSTNSITAVYSGDALYAAATSAAASLTLSPYTGSTYTNPLALTDTVNNTGAVFNCPDPAIVKSQTSGADTWYAYCTGDAFNNSDTATTGGALRAHLISIFSSSDLIHWAYVRDAFAALPAYAAAGTELYEPAIKQIGSTYTLYFRAITNSASTAYAGGTGYAIGVGTAASPAGPFTYTSSTTPLIADYEACGNTCNATTQAPEIVSDGTNYWLSYGGTFGGLYIQQLNSTGTATANTTKTSIAIDNYYTNPYVLKYNGYYYLFATPAGNCCSGIYSTYSVRVGRSASITGPYLDAEGNDMNAAAPSNGQTQGEPGGDTVLVNTGNTIYGPGSNTVFTDEAGQTYVLYSGVSGTRACLTSGITYGSSCYTARQLMMDPIDWVNGWPVVRDGSGGSDQPQPVPASQPNATNGYATPVYIQDAPGTQMAAYSQDFTGATSFNSEFAFIHQNPNISCQSDGSGNFAPIPGDTPGFSASGYTLCSNFAASDSSYPGDTMAQLPILAEAEPVGNYLLEIKFHSLVPPTTCCTANFSSQGILVYSNDNTYLRLDEAADFDTRQIEYLNQLSSLSTDFYAPVGTPNGANYTYLRLAKRITNTTTGAATYTSYSSVDGVHYVRGPAWNVSYGTSGTKVGIFSGNTGFGATFSYIHVSSLTP
jgi:arabinan endo-1,5-alpha-L-arabinosidase